jgi:hypothetical protein
MSGRVGEGKGVGTGGFMADISRWCHSLAHALARINLVSVNQLAVALGAAGGGRHA